MEPRQPTATRAPARDTTVEELLGMISRLAANEPHPRCRPGEGPLAPVALALNELSARLEARRTSSHELFGLETLVAQSPVMMISVDADERIRFMNYTLPGLSLSEVVGRRLYDFTAPEQVEVIKSNVRAVLETGESRSYEVRSPLPIGPEWYGAKVAPIRSEGQVVGCTLSLMDITDLKKTQFRLERSNQALDGFASVASHDLQEPLRKIQTLSDRLRTTCADSLGAEGRDYLERMNNAAVRMRALIDDLLSFSRVSSRAQPFEQVDLQQIAREVLDDLETVTEQTRASISVGALPVLEADPMQMRQLLQNLLSNALKFRRDDVAPCICIQGTVDAGKQQLQLRVEDNGIGFDEKYQERIFALFQRLHGRSKYEGTGIGLSICRKIAERHGGSILARSTPGQGSTFIVTLPLEQRGPV
ncbi:ATP-binding protein [Archangium sp.]|uniref:PAS domain-containing sensor histidine kinase n=1 Tax=Archangium sp. TaxID=1872627 RepID=UPI00389B2801